MNAIAVWRTLFGLLLNQLMYQLSSAEVSTSGCTWSAPEIFDSARFCEGSEDHWAQALIASVRVTSKMQQRRTDFMPSSFFNFGEWRNCTRTENERSKLSGSSASQAMLRHVEVADSYSAAARKSRSGSCKSERDCFQLMWKITMPVDVAPLRVVSDLACGSTGHEYVPAIPWERTHPSAARRRPNAPRCSNSPSPKTTELEFQVR